MKLTETTFVYVPTGANPALLAEFMKEQISICATEPIKMTVSHHNSAVVFALELNNPTTTDDIKALEAAVLAVQREADNIVNDIDRLRKMLKILA